MPVIFQVAHLQCAHFWCWIKWWMVFVQGLVCLITADIIGHSYSHSPPTFLHSSNTKYGVGKSAHRPEGKRHIPQNRKKLHNSAWAFLVNTWSHSIRNSLSPGYCLTHVQVSLTTPLLNLCQACLLSLTSMAAVRSKQSCLLTVGKAEVTPHKQQGRKKLNTC